MGVGYLNVSELVRRLATRTATRTEATVQADLHALLLTLHLGLEDANLQDIVLESPAGQRRRIDIEVGFTVIEVKRDLRTGNVRTEAVEQLAGYVRSRADAMHQRYVGVLTDGVEWTLYHLTPADALEEVSSYTVSPADPDIEALSVWLESVLATTAQITPTPVEIERRLGADSPAHRLDFADLAALYQANRDRPGVAVKRELWAKLLTTAFGSNFTNDDALFIEHTVLVSMADVIAHAVVGYEPASLAPATILSGQLFDNALIGGVVEEDFFDWPLEVDGGESFLRTLARRLSRFAWSAAEHDVMKVLYESVIDAEQRHSLGEYYTPDWLCYRMVADTVEDPLNQRVLDPACGSGTFLFHAVRRYLDTADEAGVPIAEALRGVGEHVIGVDVHPLAVTFARVTYLLAIGMARIQSPERGPVSVSVYLGDSVQWGQDETLFGAGMLRVATEEGVQLFTTALEFPEALIADAGQFDRLVAELADKATNRPIGSAAPSLTAVFRRFAVAPDHRPTLAHTFQLMCDLHDQGRDHIWGYYVRNLARPRWLSRPANRVDVLIGNPPWLSYRYMPERMQGEFRTMSTDRRLWSGGHVATHQDLSDLFVARCIELYLRAGGRFAFVMPRASLSRRAFAGFRAGDFSSTGSKHASRLVSPGTWIGSAGRFPVPSAVVFGERITGDPGALPSATSEWAGRLPHRDVSWGVAESVLTQISGRIADASAPPVSPYNARFGQGASIVPRLLFLVEDAPSGPLGAGAGRRSVRSIRSRQEKEPWRDLPTREGIVERQFVAPLHLGATVAPFRCLQPLAAVIPRDENDFLGVDSRLDMYPGLADWWRRAEALWEAHRSSDRMSLLEQLDFRRKASQQFPIAPHRVVYTKAGSRLAAARLTDSNAIVDDTLYWAAMASIDEARYLAAILNSAMLTARVAPLQARGQFGARHFDKYVFHVAIPLYREGQPAHQALASLGARAEAVAAEVQLPYGVHFKTARRLVRRALEDDGVAAEVEAAVEALIPPPVA